MTRVIDLRAAQRVKQRDEEIAQLREEVARLRSCLYAQESIPVLYSEVKRLNELTDALSRENANLRAVLRAKQEPEGHRAERIADWLREQGYSVTPRRQAEEKPQ
jgi:hypothetical protein